MYLSSTDGQNRKQEEVRYKRHRHEVKSQREHMFRAVAILDFGVIALLNFGVSWAGDMVVIGALRRYNTKTDQDVRCPVPEAWPNRYSKSLREQNKNIYSLALELRSSIQSQ